MPSPRQRLPELDALRGIAALAVVFYQTLLSLQLSDSIAHRLLSAMPTHPIFNVQLAVVFFFVLSGAVLTRGLLSRSPGSLVAEFLSFDCQRATRLCVPSAAVLALSAIAYWVLWRGPWPGSELFSDGNTRRTRSRLSPKRR
jgi:peptidoglycan/LPS O-acetylase OafA/YrhL